MRSLLLAALLALGLIAEARADSTVPALSSATSLSLAETYLALGGGAGTDTKAGFDTGKFCLSAGSITLCASSIGTTQLSSAAVTYVKMQNGASNGLLGVNSGGSPSEVAVGTGLSLSGGILTATGGAPAFSAITSGTNTTMAAVVGSGASLTQSGSGVISANQIGGTAINLGTLTNGDLCTWTTSGSILNYNTATGSSGVTFTDGSHTVSGATQLTITGGTVGGSTPNATLTITGSSGSINGTSGELTLSSLVGSIHAGDYLTDANVSGDNGFASFPGVQITTNVDSTHWNTNYHTLYPSGGNITSEQMVTVR